MRVNLYHARQAITAKIEVESRGAVDAAVGTVLDAMELLDLLPPCPWRNDGLVLYEREAALEDLLRQVSNDRGGNYPRAFIDSRARLATFLTQISVVIAVARRALRDRRAWA